MNLHPFEEKLKYLRFTAFLCLFTVSCSPGESPNVVEEYAATKSTKVFSAVIYDATNKTITLTFQKGGVYEYRGVPKSMYSNMLNSRFPGSFYNHHIKNEFPMRRLE